MALRVLLVDDSAGFLETARAFLETERILVVRARGARIEASRARIVAAGDEARRPLERDLHDGGLTTGAGQERREDVFAACSHTGQSVAASTLKVQQTG
jgi:hypothetical protein